VSFRPDGGGKVGAVSARPLLFTIIIDHFDFEHVLEHFIDVDYDA
jgi:hypothetical protein